MSVLEGHSVVWVLWHRYLDGSGAHVERVYVDEFRAKEDFELLTGGPEPSTKSTACEWKLDKAHFVPSVGR